MNRFAGVREKAKELEDKYKPEVDYTLPPTEYPTLVDDAIFWPKEKDSDDQL